MKLKNKHTGEIIEVLAKISFIKRNDNFIDSEVNTFDSLAKLNEEWEDYQEPKEYWWYIDNLGVVNQATFITVVEQAMAKDSKEIGNYFETKEEAEKAVEKLKAWKRLKDNDISFEAKVIDGRWYLGPKVEPKQRTFDEVNDLFKDVMFIFGGEE